MSREHDAVLLDLSLGSLDAGIEFLMLSSRPIRLLRDIDVRCLRDLVSLSPERLRTISGLGLGSLNEIARALAVQGLRLSMSPADVVAWSPDPLGWSEAQHTAAVRALQEHEDIMLGDGHAQTSEHVYVVRCGVTGLRKIGVTINPTVRFNGLRTQSPTGPSMTLEAVVPGSYALERALHARFAEKRRHGEWFALVDEDVDTIRALAATEAW